MAKTADELFLAQALELARQGIGLASPNPCVGAVIVDELGRIVGRGFHTYSGVKHAEVLALEEAGEKARGNTLYLNLEPCSHSGRTGPCADAIIEAGIGRVVCSMTDPNPLVAGKGFEKLRAAGIDVEAGLLEDEARKLNEAFAKHIRTGLPLVTLKSAMTLDGKIAPASLISRTPTALGSGQASTGYISGEQSLRKVHEMRHASDAILVGVGTVIADDPLLTDRSGLLRRRPLLRVILDSRLRIPLESRVILTAQDDVLVLCSFAEEHKRRALERRGIRVERVPLSVLPQEFSAPAGHDGRPDLQTVFDHFGRQDVTSVLVEGGAMVNSACLAAGVVDKIFFFFAPKIFGGMNAVPLLSGGRTMTEALSVKNLTLHRYGDDFAVEGYLRDPYGEPLQIVSSN